MAGGVAMASEMVRFESSALNGRGKDLQRYKSLGLESMKRMLMLLSPPVSEGAWSLMRYHHSSEEKSRGNGIEYRSK